MRMTAPVSQPVSVRVAVFLAILGIGTSLAFMVMPGTTTTVRVVSGVAFAVCLGFVAIVWRQIGTNQRFDAAVADWRANPENVAIKEANYLLKKLGQERDAIVKKDRERSEAREAALRGRRVMIESGFR